MAIKGIAYSYGHLALYRYLIRTYLKFLTVGKCLNSPLVLQIQTQSFCNGRCSICPYRLVSKKLDQGAMEWDLFAKIAKELASEPLLSDVVFELHNDPLLDKRIFDWVKYVKSITPDKRCTIVTNGELLDNFSSTDIRQSKVDSLVISLNAHSKEMYESMNNGLDYDRVMRNVSRLLSDQSLRQKVMLSFVLTEQNVHEVYQATLHWKGQGVRTRVMGVANRAGTLDNYERIKTRTEYYGSPLPLRIWRYLMSMARGATGCPLPFYQMNILFNGDAILCCHDWNRASVVGNAGISSLREVWISERMNEIRRLILRKRYEDITSCQGCSLVT